MWENSMDGCFVAGADPELMLISPEGDLVSAIGLIEGTKAKPQEVPGGAVQRDNVMAEFNVKPSYSDEEFIDNIQVVMGELAKLVRPNKLTVQAYAEFPEGTLNHEEARNFGCNPDWCAWPDKDGMLAMNRIPAHKALEPFRSAGGHFHLGHKEKTQEILCDEFGRIEIVKMLDIFQGIPSVLLDPDPSAKHRRVLYGTAGAHRPKEYGVEYRALGNFWLRSPAMVHLMYQLADRAVELTLDGKSQDIIKEVSQVNVENIINKSQTRKAKSVLVNVLQKYLPKQMFEDIRTNSPNTAVRNSDLYQTWRLTT
jgi:hypothetical protein